MKAFLLLAVVAMTATAAPHRLLPAEIASYQASSEAGNGASLTYLQYLYGKKEYAIDTAADTFFHSNKEIDPYWEVTLSQPMHVESIVAYHRPDCCHDRFVNGRIIVYDVNGRPSYATGVVQRDGSNKMTFSGINHNAYKIRFVLEADTWLEILDMNIQVSDAVIDETILTPSDVQSIQASSPTQPQYLPYTPFQTYGPQDLAFDNNDLTFFHSPELTNPYWEVTLTNSHFVVQVVAPHRVDCCVERYKNGVLEMWDAQSNLLYTSAQTQPSNNVMYFLNLNVGGVKRIRLTLQAFTWLELSELQVKVAPGNPNAEAFCDDIEAKCTTLKDECTTIRNNGQLGIADDCDATATICDDMEADCRDKAQNCPASP